MMKLIFNLSILSMNMFIFYSNSMKMYLSMMMMMTICSFINNYYYTHPMLLNLMMLFMMMSSLIMLSIMKMYSWFSFMIFLIIISGLMILFMYFMNFSINEYSILPKNQISKLIFKMNLMFMFMMIFIKPMNLNLLENKMFFNKLLNNEIMIKSINYMMLKIINYQSILMMIYLMVFLLIISYMCKTKKMMIRQM